MLNPSPPVRGGGPDLRRHPSSGFRHGYSKRLSLRNQQIEISRWISAGFPYAGQKSAGWPEGAQTEIAPPTHTPQAEIAPRRPHTQRGPGTPWGATRRLPRSRDQAGSPIIDLTKSESKATRRRPPWTRRGASSASVLSDQTRVITDRITPTRKHNAN